MTHLQCSKCNAEHVYQGGRMVFARIVGQAGQVLVAGEKKRNLCHACEDALNDRVYAAARNAYDVLHEGQE